ncbi:copine-8-like isoform X1 [Dinothrombium tinctorium]|uniref:Copine-8-like isoform X1 n=1 Tax=Dinothrombium tinctorium TaxID=1965070 RepID=A0A443R9L8_9ACAR|nr:copine-8-like isoform X1 [Dinothrombium tinctorium]
MENANKWQANSFTSKLELSISCRNLINADLISKSDPQVVVYMKDSFRGDYFEIGRTEVIDDNLNPDFVKKIAVDYNFETVQNLKFEVFDIDYGGSDFLGRMETTLAEIVANKGSEFVRPLVGIPNRECGVIIINVEEVSTCNNIVELDFRGREIKKLGWFFKPHPMLAIWRSNEGGSFSVVYRTEYRSYSSNPIWSRIRISVKDLCNGDYDRNLRFDCMSYQSSGDHKLIGSFFTNLNDLLKNKKPQTFKLWNDKLKAEKGFVELTNIRMEERFSFLDFIRGGTQLHFVVAIDFTASNGDPKSIDSLHYFDPVYGKPNSYEIALRAIGEIVQYYNDNGYFAGFGFGARIPPNYDVSHEFPLNGNPAHPYCQGVEDLVANYRRTLSSVTLYGPTNFANVINSTARIASQYQHGENYFILLIITDGIICDMPQTKRAIIAASSLPLSIIIVGVGNADFSAMDELDSDDKLLSIDNQKAKRDIVQFVEMNKFLNGSRRSVISKAQLAKEVLFEVPEQVVSYMAMKGIKPVKRN